MRCQAMRIRSARQRRGFVQGELFGPPFQRRSREVSRQRAEERSSVQSCGESHEAGECG